MSYIKPDALKEVIEGYFNGTNFYTDAGFTNLITPESGKIYINIAVTPATQYHWSGSAYVQIGGKATVFSDTTIRTHTGTTVYTRLVNILIPANTIKEGDIWELDILAKRDTNGFSSNCFLTASISQTDEVTGFVRGVPIGNSSRSQIRVLRTLSFLGGGLYAFNNSGAFYDEFTQTIPRVLLVSNFNKTIDNHIYAGLTLSSASDIGIIEYVIFRKIN